MRSDHAADLRALTRAYPDEARAWAVYAVLGERLQTVRDRAGRGMAGFCSIDEIGRGLVTVLAPPGLLAIVARAWEDLGGEPYTLSADEIARMRARHRRVLREHPGAQRSEFRFPSGARLTDDGRMVDS